MPTVYAYRSFSGKRADGQTVVGIIPQFDGSRYAGTNCGPASEAMRDVSQQQGVRPGKGSPWQPTGASIRARTGDTSGGTNPQQTTAATRSTYGIPTGAPRIASSSEVTAKLWAGYAVDVLVGYGPINKVRSGSPGFTGNHRIVLVGIRNTTGATEVLVADPLYDGRRSGIPRGPQWLRWSVVLAAAYALKVDGTNTMAKKYPGKAYFIASLTRTTTKKYRAVVPAGKFMVYSVSNGAITGRSAKSTGGFSAACTAPQSYPWPGRGTFQLVRLTSGSRSGKYINAKYAKEV